MGSEVSEITVNQAVPKLAVGPKGQDLGKHLDAAFNSNVLVASTAPCYSHSLAVVLFDRDLFRGQFVSCRLRHLRETHRLRRVSHWSSPSLLQLKHFGEKQCMLFKTTRLAAQQ